MDRYILILSGVLLLAASQFIGKKSVEKAEEVVKQIENLIPKHNSGMADMESEMPVYQIGDVDFIGLLELKSYQIKLPVANESKTENIFSYPGRLWGNAYQNSLVLEGKNIEGQFEFLSQIDVGEEIVFVDMTGAEFRYVVKRIDRVKKANIENVLDTTYDLTLLTKDSRDNQYIVARCESIWSE